MSLIFVLLNIILNISLSLLSEWKDEFDYNTFLDEEKYFRLYWSDINTDEIEFGLEVFDCIGWISIGISPNGQMPASDIMIGWIDENGKIYLQDRHTKNERNIPILDKSQDLTLIEGEQYENNNITVTRIRFKRYKIICNNSEDLSIDKGTIRIIYAYNPFTYPISEYFDDINNGIEWHGSISRGSKSINIDTGLPLIIDLSNEDINTIELRMNNIIIPNTSDTTYYCKLMKLPTHKTTQHIVKFEPIIHSGNENVVHHMVLYLCPPSKITSISHINHQSICEDWEENMPSKDCWTGVMQYAWSAGGSDFYFPLNVGLPMSGNSDFQYVLLEIHYDNPMLLSNIIDSSGLKVSYTNNLRQYDAGMLWIGAVARPLAQIIPPHINNDTYISYIPSECTANGLPSQGVYAFGSTLHEHLIGKSISLSVIRNGIELAPIDLNQNWDFNYQQLVVLNNQYHLLPGDELILKCKYDSSKRDFITYGDLSTTHEMCMDMLYVYPAPKLSRMFTAYDIQSILSWLHYGKSKGYIEGNIPYPRNFIQA
eukprot:764637_1